MCRYAECNPIFLSKVSSSVLSKNVAYHPRTPIHLSLVLPTCGAACEKYATLNFKFSSLNLVQVPFQWETIYIHANMQVMANFKLDRFVWNKPWSNSSRWWCLWLLKLDLKELQKQTQSCDQTKKKVNTHLKHYSHKHKSALKKAVGWTI